MAEERQSIDVSAYNTEAGRNFELHCAKLVKQTKPIIFPLLELPFQKNTQFTGREKQLAQISDYLSQQNTLAITNSVNTTLAQAIAGLGGVGKSQLAIEYAYRAYEKSTYQIIWFINGQNLDVDYLRLAAQLKIYGENKDDIIERTKRKLQELGNYLLIIDDAENYEAIKNYLPQTGNNGHVLITTRYRLDWSQILELGVFILEEAVDYFKKITKFKEEEKQDVIHLIEKLLGLLPLALTQAGAFIKQTDISVKKYIEFFETKLKELWGVEDKVRDYSQTITVTWDITINRIKQKYPQAEDLLRGMSCLASTPNKIDQSWLSGLIADEQIRATALGQLADYSMIDRHQERNHFTVHSLVQEVIFESLSLEKKQYYLAQMYDLLKSIYPCKPQEEKTEDYVIQYQLLPHLEALLKPIEQLRYLNNLTTINNIQDQFLVELTLLNLMAYGYGNPHLGNDAQKEKILLERALNILEKYYDVDHPLLAQTLSNLGTVCGTLGEAQKNKILLKRALIIHEKNYGNDHPLVAQTLMSLGNAHGNLGNTLKKKRLLKRALTIMEKLYDADHLLLTKFLVTLGNSYGDLGCAQKQKTLLKRALIIEEKFYGVDHPEVAITLTNLGNAYGDLGIFKKQKMLLERALLIKEKHYGADHLQWAKTLVNLGIVYGDLGDAQKQKILLERALLIFEKYYGPVHPEVAKILRGLGNAYGVLGNVQKQKALLERALDIFENYYNADHVLIATTLSNLSNVYRSLGDNQKQKILLKQALVIYKKHLGPDHPEIAKILGNLSIAYGELGDIYKKKILLERALDIFEKYYSPDHSEIAKTLVNLGDVYGDLGDTQKQITLLERALLIDEKFYGLEHPNVALSLVNLFLIYKQNKQAFNIQKAHNYIQRAYLIFLSHPDYGISHSYTQEAKELLDSYKRLSFVATSLPDCTFSQPKPTLVNAASVDLGKQLRNAANQNNAKLLSQLIKENNNLNLNVQDNGQYQRSALHWAVIKEAVSCIKLLLLAGADLYLKDRLGNSPLDYAINSSNIEILGLLLSQRFQLPLEASFDFARLLRCAANKGEAKILEVLIGKMPELIDIADIAKNKRTALHWAVIVNHEECVRLLLNAGACVNLEDAMNKTAIDYAQLPTTAPVIRELLNIQIVNANPTDNTQTYGL